MKLEITKEELKIEDNIKKKVDIIYDFCYAEAKHINSSISKINPVYIKYHGIIIDDYKFVISSDLKRAI